MYSLPISRDMLVDLIDDDDLQMMWEEVDEAQVRSSHTQRHTCGISFAKALLRAWFGCRSQGLASSCSCTPSWPSRQAPAQGRLATTSRLRAT